MLLNIMLAIFALSMIINAVILWRNYATMKMLIFQLNGFVEQQRMLNDYLDHREGKRPSIAPDYGASL